MCTSRHWLMFVFRNQFLLTSQLLKQYMAPMRADSLDSFSVQVNTIFSSMVKKYKN